MSSLTIILRTSDLTELTKDIISNLSQVIFVFSRKRQSSKESMYFSHSSSVVQLIASNQFIIFKLKTKNIAKKAI